MKIKQHLLASALCVLPFAASAADLPVKAPVRVVQPVPFTWTGFYAGVSAGAISQDVVGTDLGDSRGLSFWRDIGDQRAVSGIGGLLGGNIGYNYQFAPNWVIGIEADISWSGADNTYVADGLRLGSKLTYLGTVRGRLGYVFDSFDRRAMLYATGGFAYGHVNNTAEDVGTPAYNANTSKTQTGWTAGGGLEYAFTNNWTVRVEGLYVDLGTTTGQVTNVTDVAVSGCRFGWKNRYLLGRLGVNYKF